MNSPTSVNIPRTQEEIYLFRSLDVNRGELVIPDFHTKTIKSLTCTSDEELLKLESEMP